MHLSNSSQGNPSQIGDWLLGHLYSNKCYLICLDNFDKKSCKNFSRVNIFKRLAKMHEPVTQNTLEIDDCRQFN